jgi:hypothetical protein
MVVYKVDRLTRSLADFAKLVELFDQHSRARSASHTAGYIAPLLRRAIKPAHSCVHNTFPDIARSF